MGTQTNRDTQTHTNTHRHTQMRERRVVGPRSQNNVTKRFFNDTIG